MKTWAAVICFLCVALGRGEAEPAAGWKVKVDVQIVAVPVADALVLIPRLRKQEESVQATKDVQSMIAEGGAELLGWPIVRCETVPDTMDSGSTSSIEIVKYPVEFLPPQIPGGVVHPPREAPPLQERLSPSIAQPTAFDTREVGHRLEVTALVEDERHLRLELEYELVQLQAMEPVLGARSERPEDQRIVQPRFYRVRSGAHVTLPNDGRALLGTSVERGPRPRMILFLLHAVATPSPTLLP